MEDDSSARDWTDIADDYFEVNKNDYDFADFLLGNNDKIYTELNLYFYVIKFKEFYIIHFQII